MKITKQTLLSLALVSTVTLSNGAVVRADDDVKTTQAAEQSTSQSTLDSKQTELAGQTEKTAQSEAAYKEAQEEHTEASKELVEAQEVKAAATEETIAQAEQAVTEAVDQVAAAEENVATDEVAVASAQEELENYQPTVDQAQSAVTQQQAVVDQAQKEVDQAQAILDGTDEKAILAEKDQAEAALEMAKSDLGTTDQELQKAEKALSDHAATLNTAKAGVDTAKTELTTAETSLLSKGATYDQAAANQKEAQATFDQAQANLQAVPVLTLTDDYVALLKQYANSEGEERLKVAEKLAIANAEVNKSKGNYKATQADLETIIPDVKNMPYDLRKELTLFVVELQNQVWEQMGTKKLQVTENSIQLANTVSDSYEAAKISTYGHYKEGLKASAQEWGLHGIAENMSYYNQYQLSSLPSVSLGKLKEMIYGSVVSMLSSESELENSHMGHALTLAGLSMSDRFYTNDGVEYTPYFGYAGSMSDDKYRGHSIFVNSKNIKLGSKFLDGDQTVLESPYRTEELTKALNQAQMKLSQANSTLGVAAENLEAAKAIHAAAEKAHQNKTALLNQAQAEQARLESALEKTREQHGVAVQKLELAQSRYDVAVEQVRSLSADVAVKKANLDKAQRKLKTEQEKLTSLSDTLAAAKSKQAGLAKTLEAAKLKLEKSKELLTQAKSAVTTATDRLSDLKNADKLLEAATLRFKKAQEELDKAKAVYTSDLEKLKELEVEAENLRAILRALSEQQAELEKKKSLQGKSQHGGGDQKATKIPVGTTPVVRGAVGREVIDKFVSESESSEQTIKVDSLVASSYLKRSISLPKTGEKSYPFNLIGSGLLASLFLGLALTYRRQQD